MHDLDRTLRELESGVDALEIADDEFENLDQEFDSGELELETADYELEDGGYELEGGDYEFEFDQGQELESGYDGEWEGELEADPQGEAVFDEVEEMELAAELLEITDEQELDYFIKRVLKKAARAGRTAIGTPAGQALRGVLRDVARKAIPTAGAALGNMVLPGFGGAAGARIASTANRIFGLELEGLSPQDQEFEVARRFVRLAGAAAQEVAQNPTPGPPQLAAKDAVVQAARQHAPGLVAGGGAGARGYPGYGAPRARSRVPQSYGGDGGVRRSGRWVRRGRKIILYGL